MRRRFLLTLASLAVLIAGAAAAGSKYLTLPAPVSASFATICVKPSGEMVGGSVACTRASAGGPFNCTCPLGSRPITAPICAPGERSANDLPGATAARRSAVSRDDLYLIRLEGRAFCVRVNGRDPYISPYNGDAPPGSILEP
jgi:hypothetical protein